MSKILLEVEQEQSKLFAESQEISEQMLLTSVAFQKKMQMLSEKQKGIIQRLSDLDDLYLKLGK